MIVSVIEPVGGHGGMDYYDYGLAFGLAENDIRVDFYTCSKTKIRSFKGVNTLYTFKNFWDKSIILKISLFFLYFLKTIFEIRKRNSKLVHLHYFSFSLHNFISLLLLKVFRLSVVVTIHDIDSFHGKSFKFIEKLSYNLINGVIVHNKESYDSLIIKSYKLPHISVIPHGNYRPFVNQLPLSTEKQVINLLFFGQIKEVKGLDILLRAFAKVVKQSDNYRLVIAGKPWKTGLDYYQNLIEDLNIGNKVETHFRYIKNSEVESFYASSDILILPYKRIYQSGVLLMSMSMGRSVIASNLRAFKEIVEDGVNGFLFDSEDIDSLATKILALDRKKLDLVTNNCIKTMDGKFDWVNIGRQTKNFYKKVFK
ncbi:glycosyltransferase family 4 protein [Carboxylicivirga sp. N1Y90]|uniref:glycosyltransferase family 4 protein n=1 Tax=Carboxylicivirga fragile TaxID=3417571 RepID=UPI003D35094F|nr:glycosyltransferase family 4 protein [Marinilabiliaceae bacterium N1Y90]